MDSSVPMMNYHPNDLGSLILILVTSEECTVVLVIPQRGYSQKNWVGVGDPLPKTLTLFMT